MSIGSVIKESRLRKNIKQSDLAKKIGVTVQTCIKWEADETEPKASQVAKISKELGISSNAICAGQEDTKMDLTGFIRYFSKVVNHANDFEVGLTIWESIENDSQFIENLRKNAGIAFEPARTEFDPSTGDVYFYDHFGNEISDPLFDPKEVLNKK